MALSRGGAWPTPVEGTAVSGGAQPSSAQRAAGPRWLGHWASLRPPGPAGWWLLTAHWCCSPSFHPDSSGSHPSQSLSITRV